MFQSFLTLLLLVITFSIHANGIMEIYSKSLVGIKNLLIFPDVRWQANFSFPICRFKKWASLLGIILEISELIKLI